MKDRRFVVDRLYNGERKLVSSSNDFRMLPSDFGVGKKPFVLEGFKVSDSYAGEKIVFTDVLELEGEDVSELAWWERFSLLKNFWSWGKWVKTTSPFVVGSKNEFVVACRVVLKLPFSKGVYAFEYGDSGNVYKFYSDGDGEDG